MLCVYISAHFLTVSFASIFSQMYNEEFTNLEEFRLFCRRADKLLPATLAEIDEFVSPVVWLLGINNNLCSWMDKRWTCDFRLIVLLWKNK